MKPGRELNVKIANLVFGYNVFKAKGVWTENHPLGDCPLRNYSNELQWAWEVADKMKITLIPTLGGNWFAFACTKASDGWESPQAVFEFLQAGNFEGAGAAFDMNPALAICTAALYALEKKDSNVPHETDTDMASEAGAEAQATTQDSETPAPIH